eukprot:2289780-Alexandrium_andersonii.AAC.1
MPRQICEVCRDTVLEWGSGPGAVIFVRVASSSAHLRSIALSVFTYACRLARDSGPGRQAS